MGRPRCRVYAHISYTNIPEALICDYGVCRLRLWVFRVLADLLLTLTALGCLPMAVCNERDALPEDSRQADERRTEIVAELQSVVCLLASADSLALLNSLVKQLAALRTLLRTSMPHWSEHKLDEFCQ